MEILISYPKSRFDFLIIRSNLRVKDHGQGEYLKIFPIPRQQLPNNSIDLNN